METTGRAENVGISSAAQAQVEEQVLGLPLLLRMQGFKLYTLRPLSSSFLWFIFRIL